ncbi:MAG: hypothetical protein EA419_12195 [Wenzhouxiangella sp.]|nr:MAG: hypothetical protein EA419_12195 [Wenzhouxiangella sp.]
MNRIDNNIRLRDGVRAIAERDALKTDELSRLKELTRPADAPASPSRRRWLAAAAGLGAVGIAGYFGLSTGLRSDNVQRMAEEVAGNHLRASPLDVVTGDLERAREAFATLGFHLLDAAEVEDVPGRLLGGRFCSIASIPAALLRYQYGTRLYTVYQARYDKDRHSGAADMDRGEPGAVRHVGGVEVCLCHTQGVLLAVASGGVRVPA